MNLALAFASPALAPVPQSSLIDSIFNNPSIPEVTLAELGVNETLLNAHDFGLAKRQTTLKVTICNIQFNDGYGEGRLIISNPVPTEPGTTKPAHPLDILFIPTLYLPPNDNEFCFYTNRYMLKLPLIDSVVGYACTGGVAPPFDTTSYFNITSNRVRAYLAELPGKPEALLPRFKFSKVWFYNDMFGGGIDIQFDKGGKVSGLVGMLGHQRPPFNTGQFMIATFSRTFRSVYSSKITIPLQ
ncbi:unnamed protein product [Fusarium graminearum]|nr:unnamed protein product [Fusarium graminearum]CAG1990316.1 unnamed protein product [Fusarium graminearum]